MMKNRRMMKMDCEIIRKQGIAERYRKGELSPGEIKSYERHYFACDSCYEDLAFHDRIAETLLEKGAHLFAGEIEKDRKQRLRDRFAHRKSPRLWFDHLLPDRPAWIDTLVTAAAVIFIAVLVTRFSVSSHTLKPQWTPVPHPFIAAELRDGPRIDPFFKAMEFYQQGEYKEAAAQLKECIRSDPSHEEGRFYLGVSHLLLDNPRRAVQELAAALRLAPSSNLYRWYLAQALFLSGRDISAERELNKIIASESEYADEALLLIDEIRSH